MNSHLFLQYGLHDDAVSNFPYTFLWIHQLPEYTQVLSEFCWMHYSHNFHNFYKAQQEPLMFPTSYARSWWFLWILCPRGRWNKFLAIFVHCRGESFLQTTSASPSAWHSFPLTSITLAIGWSGLDVSCFLVNLPPDQVYPSGAFSSSRDKSREPSMFQ